MTPDDDLRDAIKDYILTHLSLDVTDSDYGSHKEVRIQLLLGDDLIADEGFSIDN